LKNNILLCLVIFCLYGVVSCTTTTVTDESATDVGSVTPPKTGPKDQYPTTKPTVGASAMQLLELARQQAESGQGELAAATLERAIKIEPENPWLWHRLAVLRMQQKKWPLAIELANRSIALAKGNKRLIGGNWLVISLALEGAGNYEAAKRAKKNSDVYLGKSNQE